MWNTVTIQYNPLIEEEWDEHFKVRKIIVKLVSEKPFRGPLTKHLSFRRAYSRLAAVAVRSVRNLQLHPGFNPSNLRCKKGRR
jgi:hypothetical protein